MITSGEFYMAAKQKRIFSYIHPSQNQNAKPVVDDPRPDSKTPLCFGEPMDAPRTRWSKRWLWAVTWVLYFRMWWIVRKPTAWISSFLAGTEVSWGWFWSVKLGWGEFWFIFTGRKTLFGQFGEERGGRGVGRVCLNLIVQWKNLSIPARSLLPKVGGVWFMVRHGEIAQETGVPLCHQLCQGGPSWWEWAGCWVLQVGFLGGEKEVKKTPDLSPTKMCKQKLFAAEDEREYDFLKILF